VEKPKTTDYVPQSYIVRQNADRVRKCADLSWPWVIVLSRSKSSKVQLNGIILAARGKPL